MVSPSLDDNLIIWPFALFCKKLPAARQPGSIRWLPCATS